jgi:hypothetical protein
MATSCSAPNAAKLGRWYERYPQPSVKVPPQLAKETLLQWIQEGKQPGRDFVVVDVRGSDHTVRSTVYPISLNPLSSNFRVASSADLSTFLSKACILHSQLCTSYSPVPMSRR